MQDVRIDRHKYIGGSDIPVIMGISPFKTRWQLLQEKAQIIEDTFRGNTYTEYGNTLEPLIRDYVNEHLGKDFVEAKIIDGYRRYHADGYDKASNMVLEIKTTSNFERDSKKQKIYESQLIYGMQMYGAVTGVLAVYDRPSDFSTEFDPFRLDIILVNMSDKMGLLDEVNSAVECFMDDLTKLRENPNLTETELIPSQVNALAKIVDDIEDKLRAFDELKKQQELVKEELRQAMLKYGVKSWEMPSGTRLTLVLDGEDKEVWELDKDAFAKENPDLWKKYQKKTIKKGRKGYVKVTR